MGMFIEIAFIEIAGEYPCGKCGVLLTGWQSKELRYHGCLIEPPFPERDQPAPQTEVDDGDDGGYRRIVREAKPPKRNTENSAATRYGRESHGNARYNEALDDYERA